MVKKPNRVPKYVPQVPMGIGIPEIGAHLKGGGLLVPKKAAKKRK